MNKRWVIVAVMKRKEAQPTNVLPACVIWRSSPNPFALSCGLLLVRAKNVQTAAPITVVRRSTLRCSHGILLPHGSAELVCMGTLAKKIRFGQFLWRAGGLPPL
jgi:hypothetical protein